MAIYGGSKCSVCGDVMTKCTGTGQAFDANTGESSGFSNIGCSKPECEDKKLALECKAYEERRSDAGRLQR